MKKTLLTLATALTCATGLHAAELGAAAQPLDIKEWVKGSVVDIAAGKGTNVYVIEFWATWCPPCIVSIPHLTGLQKKFKDKGVVIIGVTDESPDDVKKFVEKMGDKMNYTIAVDGGKTVERYPAAFGLRGIPQAFIVDKAGNVVWNGRPMDGLDEAIENVLNGKHDLAKATAQLKAEIELIRRQLGGKEPEPKAPEEKTSKDGDESKPKSKQ